MRAIVAVVILAGFFGYLALVTWHPALLPGDTLGMILGGLIAISGAVVQFYFGTTAGSTAKDKTGGQWALISHRSPTNSRCPATSACSRVRG